MSIREVIKAADALSALLEAALPKRGLKHPRHAKHLTPARKAIADVLKSYFGRQRDAVLREIEPHIQSALESFPPLVEAARTPTARRFASTVLPSSLHPLRFAITPSEESAYDTAMTGAIMAGARVLAAELETGSVISPNFAGAYLRENSLGKLTGGFSETSIERLQNAIANAWDQGGSYDQIVAAVKDTFAEFSDYRAGMVAQTEANDAYNAGRREMADTWGASEHAWETESGDPCEICLANEAQGWIPIDDEFQSGDLSPSAHPWCSCDENFRKSGGGSED